MINATATPAGSQRAQREAPPRPRTAPGVIGHADPNGHWCEGPAGATLTHALARDPARRQIAALRATPGEHPIHAVTVLGTHADGTTTERPAGAAYWGRGAVRALALRIDRAHGTPVILTTDLAVFAAPGASIENAEIVVALARPPPAAAIEAALRRAFEPRYLADTRARGEEIAHRFQIACQARAIETLAPDPASAQAKTLLAIAEAELLETCDAPGTQTRIDIARGTVQVTVRSERAGTAHARSTSTSTSTSTSAG